MQMRRCEKLVMNLPNLLSLIMLSLCYCNNQNEFKLLIDVGLWSVAHGAQAHM